MENQYIWKNITKLVNDELFKLNLSFFNHTKNDYKYDYRSNIKKKQFFQIK